MIKKEPLLALLTDTHLNHKNIDLVESIFLQALKEVKALGLSTLYHAGDMFDSRKHQTLATLRSFAKILKIFHDSGVIIRGIPGNHDKPDYFSERSYLDIYEMYPSLSLSREGSVYQEGDYNVHMMPFFDEEIYPKILSSHTKNFSSKGKHILITHIAVDGVKNNDGSEIEDTLSTKVFSLFESVFVGHYHDRQSVENIHYVGSAYQKDFGENEDKGLSVIYTDGTYDQIKLTFPTYKTVPIDINKISSKDYKDLVDKSRSVEGTVRFKISGTKEKLKSLDRQELKRAGIDLKTVQDDPEVNIDYSELLDFSGFDKEKILSEWDDFSKKNNIGEEITASGRKRMSVNFNS